LQLIHVADLHVGAKPYNDQRLRDHILEAFDRLVEEVVRERPDVLIIAGDLFHSPRPENDHVIRVLNAAKRITARGTRIIVAHGDHDTPGRRDKTVLQLLAEAVDGFYAPVPASLETIGRDMTVQLDGAVFAVFPYKKISPEKKKTYAREYAVPALARALERASGRRVFVGHLGLEDVFPFGAFLSSSELPRADYHALGHLHWRRVLERLPGGPGGYPGSLYPLNLDEARQGHVRGGFIVDLSGDEATIQDLAVEVALHLAPDPLDLAEIEGKGSNLVDAVRRRLSTILREAALQAGQGREVVVWLEVVLGSLHSPGMVEAVLRNLPVPRDVILVPRYRWARKKHRDERESREAEGSLDPVELLVEMYGISREAALEVLALKDMLAEGRVDDERLIEALERLARHQIYKIADERLGR